MPGRIPSKAIARGRRTHLRRPGPADQAELLQIQRQGRSFHQPWVSLPASPQEFADWLEGAHIPTRERLLLCANQGGAIVGYFSVGEIYFEALKSAFLGYWANSDYARQGLMREGIELILRHAFRGLRLHRLEANIQPENVSSIELVRSCGFRLEGYSPRYLKLGGRWRDHQHWAMTREDWVDPARPRS